MICHDLNKILLSFHCRVSELLDYTADDLTGQSLYALCHGEDVHKMRKTHEDRKTYFSILYDSLVIIINITYNKSYISNFLFLILFSTQQRASDE